jgi:hypothetical protein
LPRSFNHEPSRLTSPLYYPDDVLMRIFIVFAFLAVSIPATTGPGVRLELIRKRGFLTCGIEANVPGFSEVDADGRHHGFDIDICRAIAAAVIGNSEALTRATSRLARAAGAPVRMRPRGSSPNEKTSVSGDLRRGCPGIIDRDHGSAPGGRQRSPDR